MMSMRILMVLSLGIGLAACGSDIKREARYPSDELGPETITGQMNRQTGGGLFSGEDGLVLFGGPDSNDSGSDGGGGGGIGVNSYLWRATLDTVSFLPLDSADPFGGVIITDWYAPPEAPAERFKVTAYILDRSLRADGIRVSVFRQIRQRDGSWADAPVSPQTATDIEDAILTRARQLRIETAASG